MKRRRYLALAGTALVAGCGGDSGGSEPSDTPTPTEASTPTDTPTETSVDTPTTTTTTTEASTPTDAETETETETATPDPRVKEITAAIDHIEKALEHYAIARHLTDRDILWSPPTQKMRNELYKAREALSDIEKESLPQEQKDRIAKARDAYWFVWWLGPTHDALRKAVAAATGDDWFGINPSTINERLNAYQEEHGKLDEDSTAAGMEVIERHSPQEYDEALSRFDRYREHCKKAIDKHKEHNTAEAKWSDAMDEHENEYYHQSEILFNEAADLYSDNATSYQKPDWPDSFSSAASTMTCYAETMTTRAEDFAEAAVHGQEDERERRIATEEGAPEPSDECDI